MSGWSVASRVADMYVERLKRGDLEVELIKNGATALTRLQEDDLPDGIILDLMLPGASGFDILDQLVSDKKTANIPTIICTAFADDDRQRRAATLGFHDYYLKTHLSPGDLTLLMRNRLGLT